MHYLESNFEHMHLFRLKLGYACPTIDILAYHVIEWLWLARAHLKCVPGVNVENVDQTESSAFE